MSNSTRRRYRRYLEPGSTCSVPRQTLYKRRKKDVGVHEGFAPHLDSSTRQEAHEESDRTFPTELASEARGVFDEQCSSSSDDNVEDSHSDSEEETMDKTRPDVEEHSSASTIGDAEDDVDNDSEEPPTERLCPDMVGEQDTSSSSFDENEDDENGSEEEDVERTCPAELIDELRQMFEAYSAETLPHQTTTKAHALLLILTFIVTAGLSWTQTDGLLKLINALLGCDVLPSSKFALRKLWKLKKSRLLKLYYYCATCYRNLGAGFYGDPTDNTLECGPCSTKYSVQKLRSQGNFFIMFDLKQQLCSLILELNSVLYRSLRAIEQAAHDTYSDLTDGQLYRNIRRQLCMKWHDFTVTFNTDGSPVFKSSKLSVWPIQVILNELPVRTRWRTRLLAGLWLAKEHPPLHLPMKTFVEEFNRITEVVWKHGSDILRSKVYAIACVADSPARAAVLNMKQFNGYFGCTWCLEEGCLVDGTVKYPFTGNLIERSHGDVIKDMKTACLSGAPSHGVKGATPLALLRGFDLVWSVPPDYMHAVLEGVMKQITDLWLSSTREVFYIGNALRVIDARLCKIKPPISFTRLPRSLSERGFWKATEWKYFLLFYSLPCLHDLLPQRHFTHLCLLSQSIFLLLKSAVTQHDISEAWKLVVKFVENVPTLYGAAAATFNVHALLHLPKSVEMLGPLWATSAFPFEGGNGDILKLVTAAKGVPLQIAERSIMHLTLRMLKCVVELPTALQKVCCQVGHATTKEQMSLLGAPEVVRNVSSFVKQLFLEHVGFLPTLLRYDRARLNNVVVHSSSYDRAEKTCSHYVLMEDNAACKVLEIYAYKSNNSYRIALICQIIIVSAANFGGVNHIKKAVEPPPQENVALYHGDDVKEPCIFMSTAGMSYITTLPNAYETD